MKNRKGVVVVKLVGLCEIESTCIKSRTWSNAMMIMIMPLVISIVCNLFIFNKPMIDHLAKEAQIPAPIIKYMPAIIKRTVDVSGLDLRLYNPISSNINAGIWKKIYKPMIETIPINKIFIIEF